MAQYQVSLPSVGGKEVSGLGIPPYLTQPELQQAIYKELINKFAWAIGSTYRMTYTQRRSNVRLWAAELAKVTITDQGYPRDISK